MIPKKENRGGNLQKNFWKLISAIQGDMLDSAAAHSAYYIIIAFLPFCAMLLMIFRQIDIDGINIISYALRIFPDSVEEYLQRLLAEQSNHSGGMLSVSIITFIWASSSGVVAIIKSLRRIFKIENPRTFLAFRALSILYVLVFIAAFVMLAVTIVFGSSFYQFILQRAPELIVFILQKLRSVIGFVLLMVFFFFLYYTTSKRRFALSSYFLGSAVCSLGWIGFSYIFAFVVENFMNFSILYGSLATIIILMFWLVFCMYIMFFSAELVMWLETSEVKRDLSAFFKNRAARRAEKKLSSNESSKDKHD